MGEWYSRCRGQSTPCVASTILVRAMPPRLGALLAVVFWGVSFVATKAVVSEITPTTLIFTRAGLGTLLLVLVQKAPAARPAVDAEESAT
jgi:drug/metabolite transporter (DMT)-like permease